MSPRNSEARSSGLNRPEEKKRKMRRSSSRFLSVEKKNKTTTGVSLLIATVAMLCFGDLTTTFLRSGPHAKSSFSSSSFKGENGSFESGFFFFSSFTNGSKIHALADFQRSSSYSYYYAHITGIGHW